MEMKVFEVVVTGGDEILFDKKVTIDVKDATDKHVRDLIIGQVTPKLDNPEDKEVTFLIRSFENSL